jgi:hypothetical protein
VTCDICMGEGKERVVCISHNNFKAYNMYLCMHGFKPLNWKVQ